MKQNKNLDTEQERETRRKLFEFGGYMAMLGRAEALLEDANDIENWRWSARSSLAELMEMITDKETTAESVEVVLDYKTLFAEHFREKSLNQPGE